MDLVLQSVEGSFPAGTTVTARLVSDFPVGWRAADGVPAGAASQGTAVVQADGSLTITGLTAGTRYRLSATVSGVAVFVTHFLAPPMGESPDYAAFSDGQAAIWNAAAGRFEGFDPAKQTELDAHTALRETAHGGVMLAESYSTPYELFVNPVDGSDNNSGKSPGSAYATLRKAVDRLNLAQHRGRIRILNYNTVHNIDRPIVLTVGMEISCDVPMGVNLNRNFGTPASRSVWDAVTTAAGTSLQSATAAFDSNDVGRIAVIYGAGTGGGTYYGFISAVPDGTHATVPATAVARNSTTDPKGVKASVVGDWGRVVTDAAMTSGSAVVTSATAAWATTDIGTEVVIAGAGQNGQALRGAIKSVSGNTATLTCVASNTVSGQRCAIGVIFGDLFVFHVGTSKLKGIKLIDTSATSNRIGAAIKILSPDQGPGVSSSVADTVFEDLVTDSTGASGCWEHAIDADGSWNQNTSGTGVRRSYWRSCKFFGTRRPTETLRLNSIVHWGIQGGGIIGAAPTSVVQGVMLLDPQKTAGVQYGVNDVNFTGFEGVGTIFYCEGQFVSFMGGRLHAVFAPPAGRRTIELGPTSDNCTVVTSNNSTVAVAGNVGSDEYDAGTNNRIDTQVNKRLSGKADEAMKVGALLFETFPRRGASNATITTGSSGVQVLQAIWLPGGVSVASVFLLPGATALAWGSGYTGQHFFESLYDPDGNLLGSTADLGGTAVLGASAFSLKALSASVRTPRSGLHYISVLIVSGASGTGFVYPTWGGVSNGMNGVTPILCAQSGSSLTAPAPSITAPPVSGAVSAEIYGGVA